MGSVGLKTAGNVIVRVLVCVFREVNGMDEALPPREQEKTQNYHPPRHVLSEHPHSSAQSGVSQSCSLFTEPFRMEFLGLVGHHSKQSVCDGCVGAPWELRELRSFHASAWGSAVAYRSLRALCSMF